MCLVVRRTFPARSTCPASSNGIRLVCGSVELSPKAFLPCSIRRQTPSRPSEVSTRSAKHTAIVAAEPIQTQRRAKSVGCTFVTSSDSRNGMRCDVMRWYWYRRSYSEPDRRIWKFRQEESQGTLGESETWDESYVGAGGLLFLLLHDGSNTRGVGRF